MNKIKKLFSTPLYTTFLPQELIEQIQNVAIPRLDKLVNQDRDFLANPMSTDFLSERIVKPEEAQDFFNYIVECTNEFCEQTGYRNGNRMNYWFQDYRYMGTHRRHNHGASHVSGVFWIRANDGAGELTLENPNQMIFSLIEDAVHNPVSEYTIEHEFIKPQTGMLVLFPSYLYHEAIPSGKDAVRTVMAFNMDP